MANAAGSGEGAVAAVVPPPPALPEIDPILAWWIKRHQVYFLRMIEGTPHKIKYYGGLALNWAIIAPDIPSRLALLSQYKKGYTITQQAASDIDAKVLGVENEAEAATVDAMLGRGRDDGAPDTVEAEAEEVARLSLGARGGDQVVLAGPRNLDGTPIQYIVGHRLYYVKTLPGMKRLTHHYQLVLNALYKRPDNTWDWTTLSELTPDSEPVPVEDSKFLLTDIPTLRAQFAILLQFLDDTIAVRPTPILLARRAKTAARIASCDAVLIFQMLTAAPNGPGAGARGGGRRRRSTRRRKGAARRRRSVKK